MNKVDGFSAYQTNYYERTVATKKETDKTDASAKTSNVNQVELSDNAKKLLEELKKTYGNMDFMVADYETEEEAASYLARGTKAYSVLIDPDTLEQMAADEEVKSQNLSKLEEATGKLSDMKEQLGEDGKEVVSLGVSFAADGSVSYFAELQKTNEKQMERIEKEQEEKKESVKKEEKEKRTHVSASSIEELMEKIKNIDWSKIKEQQVVVAGSKIDYTV